MSEESSPKQWALNIADKTLGVAWKLGLVFGGTCIFLYLRRIGHTLTGLSVSDSIYLILAAASFGIVYLLFAFFIGSLGLAVGPLIVRVGLWIWRVAGKKEPQFAIRLAIFELATVPPACLGIATIISLSQHDPFAKWTLPGLAIGMYIWYSLFLGFLEKNQKDQKEDGSRIVTLSSDRQAKASDGSASRKALWLSGAVTMALPLAFGGVSGQLLDGAMRFAGFRVDDAIIYMKQPYSQLMPHDLALSEPCSHIDGYSAFKGTSVLFRGIGTSTLISFKDREMIRSIPIPNDHIIVEKRIPSTANATAPASTSNQDHST